ncbi:MAG: hypothetical protein WC508_01215 [Patescibacteria group bacterium]
MAEENNQSNQPRIDELEQLLQQNLKVSLETKEAVLALRRWIAWQRVWTVVKILIIVVPTILGIYFLPPLLKQTIDSYQQLLGSQSAGINSLEQLQQQLKR